MAGRSRLRKNAVQRQTYQNVNTQTELQTTKEIKTQDVGTQTEPEANAFEGAQLTEEVQILQQKLAEMKLQVESFKKVGITSSVQRKKEELVVAVPDSPQADKIRGKGCNCKGRCASKVCGCVKKQIPCGESCKCTHSKCQNQEPNKENTGVAINKDKVSVADEESNLQNSAVLTSSDNRPKKISKSKSHLTNKQLVEVSKKSIFSPDTPDLQKGEFLLQISDLNVPLKFGKTQKNLTYDSDTSESSPESQKLKKNPKSVKTQLQVPVETSMHANTQRSNEKKKKQLLPPHYNKSLYARPTESRSTHQGKQDDLVDFGNELDLETIDPMKPTRQLSRTPVSASSDKNQPRLSEVPLPPPKELEQEENVEPIEPPAGIDAPVVDWAEHCAQLVPCERCHRTFYPYRLKKHQGSCKNV